MEVQTQEYLKINGELLPLYCFVFYLLIIAKKTKTDSETAGVT